MSKATNLPNFATTEFKAGCTAYGTNVEVKRYGGALHVFDGNFGHKLAQVNVIRGFGYYYGFKGSAHEGVQAVVAGGIDGVLRALAGGGIRSGRDDRENGC